MKKLLCFMALTLMACMGATAYADGVEITSPPDGLAVPSGYELQVKITAPGDRVELYDNGELLAELDVSSSKAAYTIPGGLESGTHSFTAVCGGESSKAVGVTASAMEEYMLINADFEDVDINRVLSQAATGADGEVVSADGENVEIPGTNMSFNHWKFDRIMSAAAPVDSNGKGGGKAMLFEKSGLAPSTSKQFFVTYSGSGYKPTAKGYILPPKQRILWEYDMYIDEKFSSGNCTVINQIWCNTSNGDRRDVLSLNNQGMLAMTGQEKDFGWQPGTWHHYKAYIDFDAKIMDLYIDGERAMSQYPFTTAAAFDDKGVSSVRIGMAPNRNQKIYLDNVRLSILTSPPQISALEFLYEDSGEPVSGVPYDIDGIKLIPSAKADVSTLYRHISLLWEDNGINREMPFEYTETSGMTDGYIIKLPYALRQNAKYKIVVDAGFADSNGDVNINQQTLSFVTNPPTSYVKSVEYIGNTAQITFVNGAAEAVTIKAVTAVYTGGRLTGMTYQNLEAAPGASVNSISLPNGEEVKVYVWDDNFVPYYVS